MPFHSTSFEQNESTKLILLKWIYIYTYIFYSNQEARIKSSLEFSKRDCARAQEVTICSSIHVTTSLCIHKVSHAFFIQYYIKVNAITHWKRMCSTKVCKYIADLILFASFYFFETIEFWYSRVQATRVW